MATKKEIRKVLLKNRRQISEETWRKMSESIHSTLFDHPWFKSAQNIYCYIDYNREVGTRKIIEQAWKQRKIVWVPKVHGEIMEFYKIQSFDELHPGSYGILEPEENIKADGEPGLILMPGVGFDQNRNRIGYGGGYYDRYLEKYPHLQKIALAFDLQRIDQIPSEDTDIRPDYIITETIILGQE